jgi:cytidylate kinase
MAGQGIFVDHLDDVGIGHCGTPSPRSTGSAGARFRNLVDHKPLREFNEMAERWRAVGLDYPRRNDRMTRGEVVAEMRLAGIAHPGEVAWAILETNGKVNLICRKRRGMRASW